MLLHYLSIFGEFICPFIHNKLMKCERNADAKRECFEWKCVWLWDGFSNVYNNEELLFTEVAKEEDNSFWLMSFHDE